MANTPPPGKPLMTNPPPWKLNSQLDNSSREGNQHAWNRSFPRCLKHMKLLVSYSPAFEKLIFPWRFCTWPYSQSEDFWKSENAWWLSHNVFKNTLWFCVELTNWNLSLENFTTSRILPRLFSLWNAKKKRKNNDEKTSSYKNSNVLWSLQISKTHY